PMDLHELQTCIKLATGAELPVLKDEIKEQALIIGDCDDAKAQDLGGGKLPAEGLAIKTAANRLYIVGNGAGLSWGIYEFLERYVGVRWYFVGDIGRPVPHLDNLIVPPVALHDAPVFRKRDLWPV